MLDFILGNKEVIGTVVTGIGGWLGWRWLGKDIQGVFTDGADAWAEYEKAKADGVFTEDEIKRIAQKSGKVVARFIVLGIKIKSVWKK